jgi:phage baseplate assembly protein gpV
MMQRIQNIMRREAARQGSQQALPKRGIITNYDPNTYSAKVLIQPEGYETGFIPIGAEWVGNGWGMFAGPSSGDEVEINYQEGGKNAPYIGKRFYGNLARPLGVPSGEFWLVHKSGTALKFTNDENASLNVAGNLNITVAGQVNLTASGKVVASASEFDLTGNLIVTGTITATGDIFDNNQGDGSMNHIRTVYDSHTHSGVQSGGGTTAGPNQLL